MLTRARRFALLVALPLCLAFALWPVAHLYQKRARARVATAQLRAAINLDFSDKTPLSVAFVAPLLSQGGDVNVRGTNEMTMLHCLARRPLNVYTSGPAPASGLAQTSGPAPAPDSIAARAALARFLLAHGADPNTRAIMGWTPLMVAAGSSRPQLVAALLHGGAKAHLTQYAKGARWPDGTAKEIRTALVIAKENLARLRETDITRNTFNTPTQIREYQAELSAARRTVALLQVATGHR